MNFFTETAVQIFRKYQAFTSWPGIWILLRGQRVKLHNISVTDESIFLHPGEFLSTESGHLLVGTLVGALSLGDATLE